MDAAAPVTQDVPIARTDSLAIAEMWAELLGDADITCRVVPAGVGDTMLVPGQAQWELRVPPADAARARELLPEREPRATEPDGQAEDSETRSLALRWIIIGVAVFLALMLLVVGVRSFG
jgi:hypothetical protein